MEWNRGSCSACAFVRVFVCTRERWRVQERGQLEMQCLTWSGSALGANYAVILQLEQVFFFQHPPSAKDWVHCEQFQ